MKQNILPGFRRWTSKSFEAHEDGIPRIKMASTGMLKIARNFSTSGLRGAMVKPPLAVYGTEGRYASALYSAAHKQKKLDIVEKDLISINSLLQSSKNIKDFLNDPTLKKTVKTNALGVVSKQLKTSDLVTNLLGTLNENGRLKSLSGVCNTFSQVMSAHRGEVICEVVTAKALDASQMKELQTSLNSFLKKGETIKLSSKVDPEIIGGMIVSIGDKYVDMSMSSKIKNYTNLLKTV